MLAFSTSLTLATNVGIIPTKFRLNLPGPSWFADIFSCFDMVAPHDVLDMLAIFAVLLGLIYFRRTYARYICKAAMCCDKHPKIRPHRDNPFAVMPPHVIAKLSIPSSSNDASHMRVEHESSVFLTSPACVRYAYARAAAPLSISSAVPQRDDTGVSCDAMPQCIWFLPFVFSTYRAVRAYAMAGLLMVMVSCAGGPIAYILVATVAVLVAPVGYPIRSWITRIAILLCMMMATLLWAMAIVAICFTSTLWSLLDWSIDFHWRALCSLGHAMCNPLSSSRRVLLACVSWLVYFL